MTMERKAVCKVHRSTIVYDSNVFVIERPKNISVGSSELKNITMKVNLIANDEFMALGFQK